MDEETLRDYVMLFVAIVNYHFSLKSKMGWPFPGVLKGSVFKSNSTEHIAIPIST